MAEALPRMSRQATPVLGGVAPRAHLTPIKLRASPLRACRSVSPRHAMAVVGRVSGGGGARSSDRCVDDDPFELRAVRATPGSVHIKPLQPGVAQPYTVRPSGSGCRTGSVEVKSHIPWS